MSNLPTAEEWLKHFEENAYPNTPISECMIEFAKLHVEAALKAASENITVMAKNYNGPWKVDFPYTIDDYTDLHIDKDSILNAYPLENIK